MTTRANSGAIDEGQLEDFGESAGKPRYDVLAVERLVRGTDLLRMPVMRPASKGFPSPGSGRGLEPETRTAGGRPLWRGASFTPPE